MVIGLILDHLMSAIQLEMQYQRQLTLKFIKQKWLEEVQITNNHYNQKVMDH